MNEQADPNQTPPPSPPTEPGPLHGGPAPDYGGVRIPILISAIFNILAALGWFSTCFLAIVGIPLLVLGIFEILMFAKLGDPAKAREAYARARTYGVLEICTILAFNVVSTVCGIIVLVNSNKT